MRLAICGDISITPASWDYFAEQNAMAAFNDVISVFQRAHRTIVNLECAITDSQEGIRKFGPCLKAPYGTAQTLKRAGVTECLLSNNHTFDFGVKGITDTIRELDAAKLNWTGWGNNYEDSRKDHIITYANMKIAVINVCEHEYSYALEDRMGARPFDEFETMQDIRKAKAENDYVIVVYHGGKEHCAYPSPRLYKACHEMAYCGADVILCQHSHCIGCYENFEGCHILYGQGNFHFTKYMDNERWNEGLMVMLDIRYNGIQIEFIPVVEYQGGIRLADPMRSQYILEAMEARNQTLLNGEWKQHWHAFCESMYGQYKKSICGYGLEEDLDATQLFSHYLDCEAHTDVWRELFPTWNHSNEK